MTSALVGLGWSVSTTAANWVLVHTDRPLRDEAAPAGVIVRDLTSFGVAGTFRVALPRPDQLAPVVDVFAALGPMNRAIGVALGLAADRWLGEPPRAVAPGGLVRHRRWARWSGWRGGTRGWPARRTPPSGWVGRGSSGSGCGGPSDRGRPWPWRRPSPSPDACWTPRERPSAGCSPTGTSTAPGARVRSLVGRTTADVDEAGIARAVVESIAENTTDAVVAPALWAAVGGAPAVLAYRAANTLDAMVGHHTDRYERFGWASARLDDALNLVPARVAAAAVALRRPARARAVLRAVTVDARRHPSPNSGVIEAAFAASLGHRPRRRQPLRRPGRGSRPPR